MTAEQLLRARALLDAYPIEVAELRASPKQLRFQQAFFDRRDPEGDGRRLNVFVALGGNRSGKSITAGWLCFAKYLRDKAKNGDWFWCIGPTLDRSVGGVQKEIWNALPKGMFKGALRSHHAWQHVEQHWDEKIGFGAHRKIVLPTADGGRCLVEFRSADQDPTTFEQAKLTGVWIDERVSEAIFDRLLPRIIDRAGWILYSDIPEQWWQLERLVNAPPAAGVFFQHFTMYDNAANLPPGAIETASALMTEDQRKQRIAGEFMVMEGLVYKEFVDKDHKEGGHLIDPFRIPDTWPKFRVIDYGGSAPTACLWVAIASNECAYAYREYYQPDQSIEKHAAAILTMSGEEEYRKTLMDPHAIDPPPIYYGAAKTIARQYADAGIPATGWPYVNVMGEHAMVQRVKFRLEHRTLKVFKALTNFRREFRSWKYVCDSEGRPKAADAYEHANNHLLDCIKGFFGTNPCFASNLVRVARPGE